MKASALVKPHVLRDYPMVDHGKGVYLFDTNGKRYLDGCSGAMTASLGHGSQEIAEVMREQAAKVAFSYRTQFTSAPAERLAQRLADLAPGDLNWVFFLSSGSEATEYAIRAAVGHWRQQGMHQKTKILSREISYHGMTMGSLSLSGHATRRPDYGSLLHDFPVAPPAFAFRFARDDETDEDYAERAAAEFESAIIAQDPETVAALIVEPIVGAAGGVIVPPEGYMKKLRIICDRLGVLMIVDEVITGIGRTGSWFASEYEGIVPDLLVMGKGISSGYSPVAAVLLREHMMDVITAGSGVPPFGHTFSGNPLGTAVCNKVLDIMERDNVLLNVHERGAELEQGLLELASRYSNIADVRGRGLLWGFEFVSDPHTKVPPKPELNIASTFADLCFENGLIIYASGIPPLNNAMLICPPLTISQSEISELLAILDACLANFSKEWA